MEEEFSKLVNLLWKQCIANLNNILREEEVGKFSNNDYYYLLVINSLNRPKFSEVADALSLTKPAVSAIIRKLTKMELVNKVQSDKDKRVFYIELTEKGRDILNGDKEIYRKIVENIVDIVPDKKELEIINNVIIELVKRLEEN